MMGAERRSMVMSRGREELTAYHEGGHAIVGIHMEGYDPLHKVTIIPRGVLSASPCRCRERDRHSHSKRWLEQRLAVMFGGPHCGRHYLRPRGRDDRRLERHSAGDQSPPAAWSPNGAFRTASGAYVIRADEEEVFLGHSVAQRKNISDATAKIIDEEVRRLIDEAEGTARDVLSAHLNELHILANGLLEYETALRR